jgi:hypothetical protein
MDRTLLKKLRQRLNLKESDVSYPIANWAMESLLDHVDQLEALLEKIYPTLPSYLGQSETPDNPCLRRMADEVLKK